MCMDQGRVDGLPGPIHVRVWSGCWCPEMGGAYVYELPHTHMGNDFSFSLSLLLCIFGVMRLSGHTRMKMHMGSRCAIFSFYLLLMHFGLDFSLIILLLSIQTCKHMKHYIKTVK